MYREKKLKLFERYEDKEDMLPKLMKFSWALRVKISIKLFLY
jgi:hypothetical protein